MQAVKWQSENFADIPGLWNVHQALHTSTFLPDHPWHERVRSCPCNIGAVCYIIGNMRVVTKWMRTRSGSRSCGSMSEMVSSVRLGCDRIARSSFLLSRALRSDSRRCARTLTRGPKETSCNSCSRTPLNNKRPPPLQRGPLSWVGGTWPPGAGAAGTRSA